jgi:hypothetical protein
MTMMSHTEQNMSLQGRIMRVEETVKALITLLKQETRAVEAVDIQTFTQLQNTKNDLYELYYADIRQLVAHKKELKDMPDTFKARLQAWETELANTVQLNLSGLGRAASSFGRLRDRVMHFAKESVLRNRVQYGANGALRTDARRVISTGHQEQA